MDSPLNQVDSLRTALALSRKLNDFCGTMKDDVSNGTWAVERPGILRTLADFAGKIYSMKGKVSQLTPTTRVLEQLLDGLDQMAARVNGITATIERLESQCIGLVIPVGLAPEETHEAIQANLMSLGNALGRPFCLKYSNVLLKTAHTAVRAMRRAVGPAEQEARVLFKAACDAMRKTPSAGIISDENPMDSIICEIASRNVPQGNKFTNHSVLLSVLETLPPSIWKELCDAYRTPDPGVRNIISALSPKFNRNALREIADVVYRYGETSSEVRQVYEKLRADLYADGLRRSELRRILLRACGVMLSGIRRLYEISQGIDSEGVFAQSQSHGLDYFLPRIDLALGFEHIDEFLQTSDPYIYTAILWIACAEENVVFLKELWTMHRNEPCEKKLAALLGARSRCEFDMA